MGRLVELQVRISKIKLRSRFLWVYSVKPIVQTINDLHWIARKDQMNKEYICINIDTNHT
jgi:hypothetical protein